MAALKTSLSSCTDIPFFIKHVISDGTFWCADEYDNGVATGNSYCVFSNQAECNSSVTEWEYDNITYTCTRNDFTDSVSESYVGFVVTETMASNNPGMTPGTYYLKGGDNGASFIDNAKTIYDAYGGVGCTVNPYTTTPSSSFTCNISALRVYVNLDGRALVFDSGLYCDVNHGGNAVCKS